jgi:hypothetical protein
MFLRQNVELAVARQCDRGVVAKINSQHINIGPGQASSVIFEWSASKESSTAQYRADLFCINFAVRVLRGIEPGESTPKLSLFFRSLLIVEGPSLGVAYDAVNSSN